MSSKIIAISELEIIWLHALQLLAQTSEGLKKLRKLESKAAELWIKKYGIHTQKKMDMYDAAVSIAEKLNAFSVDPLVFEVTKIGETIRIHLKGHPVYNSVYKKSQRKGMKIFSLSAGIFVKIIKETTGREFRSEINTFNTTEEVIDILPLEVGLNINIARTLSRGTIKISEADRQELGLDIIDNVTITHKKSGNVFTALCYSSSKISKGTIYMSIADARIIGYKEGDKVVVERSGKEVVEDMVQEDDYDAEY